MTDDEPRFEPTVVVPKQPAAPPPDEYSDPAAPWQDVRPPDLVKRRDDSEPPEQTGQPDQSGQPGAGERPERTRRPSPAAAQPTEVVPTWPASQPAVTGPPPQRPLSQGPIPQGPAYPSPTYGPPSGYPAPGAGPAYGPPPGYPAPGAGQGGPAYGSPYGPPAGYGPPPGSPYGPPGGGYGYGPPQFGKPSSNIGWAIAAIFFFWPLAIPAFIFSAQVGSRWQRGDAAGARSASRTALIFGAGGVGLFVLILLIAIVAGASS